MLTKIGDGNDAKIRQGGGDSNKNLAETTQLGCWKQVRPKAELENNEASSSVWFR